MPNNLLEIQENPNFVGRAHERARLLEIADRPEASIVVMYGRRRVGKTELLEQTFRQRNIIKLEGVQDGDKKRQLELVLIQLAEYLDNPIVARLSPRSWLEVFDLIYEATKTGKWTLYLEELQWLACYDDELVSELKIAWDNKFRRNPNFLLLLCGSSPSFMIGNVLKSKALHNRSQHEFHLREFSLEETAEFFGTRYAAQDVLLAHIAVGGLPEYLKYLKTRSSILLSLSQEAFSSDGYFANEYERIFVSNLSGNSSYREILEYLSRRGTATRAEIIDELGVSSGGAMSELLRDLELCGFVEKLIPFHLGPNAKLVRYAIGDPYVRFYNQFIAPKWQRIERGDFRDDPLKALDRRSFETWLGFAFERYCRRNAAKIASLLDFGAVDYRSGSYFRRDFPSGFQVDLIFDRADRVITLCEIKYNREPVGMSVTKDFDRKLAACKSLLENRAHQRVLITAGGAGKQLQESAYFDKILSLDELLPST